MNDEQLTQRMRSASEAIVMSDSTQARQLAAISAALSENGVASIAPVRARRRIVASIVAAAMIAPAGLAAASESSIPGDPLYPVKQLSEKVLVLFDTDVIARHRIEEIEALEDRGASDPSLVESARLALSELGSDHALWQRLEASVSSRDTDGGETRVEDEVEEEQEQEPDTGVSHRSNDTDEPPTEPQMFTFDLPDGSQATIKVVVDDGDIIDLVAPLGWTVTEIDGDRARLGNGTIAVEVELLDDGSARVRELGAPAGDDAASPGDPVGADDDSTSGSGSSERERGGDDSDDDHGSGDS